MIVSFYLTAALLKFDPEWISGAALSGRTHYFLSGKWLEWACAYVILLEMVVVWALLANRTSLIFRLAFLQFAIFHLMSMPIVSWYYPVVMAGLLSLFLLRQESIHFPSDHISWAALAVFWILQMAPMAYPGDTGLSTQGRFFALSLLETRPMCEGLMIIRRGDDRVEIAVPVMKLPVRIWCDPLVFYDFGRAVCRRGAKAGRAFDMDFEIMAKRSIADDWRPLMRAINFCSDARTYPLFGAVPWLSL